MLGRRNYVILCIIWRVTSASVCKVSTVFFLYGGQNLAVVLSGSMVQQRNCEFTSLQILSMVTEQLLHENNDVVSLS